MLPIFSISRGGNLTEEIFYKQFDALIIAFKAKDVVVFIGIGLCLISIGILAFASFKKRKMKIINCANPELQISLQKHHFD